MAKKKLLKIGIIIIIAGSLIGAGIAYYMFNMPHRNVQDSKTDFALSSSQIVSEYLMDTQAANEKYLAADGDSKILEISGIVNKITKGYDGQIILLIKEPSDKAGVSSTFTQENSINAAKVKIGSSIIIKGVIRAGASYDEDLELYENVILEKCNIIKN